MKVAAVTNKSRTFNASTKPYAMTFGNQILFYTLLIDCVSIESQSVRSRQLKNGSAAATQPLRSVLTSTQ
jgi:hypothetical protein